MVSRMRSHGRALSLLLALSLTVALVAEVLVVGTAAAAPPVYVVAGDDPAVTGDQWGLHEAYYSDLRSVITDPANFGASGKVQAVYTIGAPRTVPLTSTSLNGVDVYFVSARNIASSEVAVLQAFIKRGGSLVINSNGPGFYDTTSWLGFTLSTRLIFGDGPAPYDTTHRAPSPSGVVSAQTTHPVVAGPFGSVTGFENWHSVAGFTTVPSGATVLARTTLTGPSDTGSTATISDVATLAVFPVGAFGAGSGPVVVTSDVDTYSNAYITALGYPTDTLCTLFNGTTNGTLARDTFAWIASQKASITPTTTTSTSTTTTSSAPTTTTASSTTTKATTTTTSTTTTVPATTTTLRKKRR